MKVDLTPVFQAIIALLAAILTYKVIPYFKSKMSKQQFDNLVAAANVAVFAAEQIFAHGDNEKKLDYAIQYLSNAGFKLDKDVLRTAVEKAVYDLKEDQKYSGSYFVQNASDYNYSLDEEDEEGDLPFPLPTDK